MHDKVHEKHHGQDVPHLMGLRRKLVSQGGLGSLGLGLRVLGVKALS